ncbi:MAG: hypothetical protein SWY16_26580 [Cyanobacteriota bacterium]|nr:hypothetical protein [Cyanobacteriota bacterium]
MSPDNLVQTIQTGFHISVGATASLLESIQDTRKREENLETLKLDWEQIANKMAQKGEQTEREARNFVDTLVEQGSSTASQSPQGPTSLDINPLVNERDAEVKTELETLTEQIVTLRKELEQLRQQEES